MRQSYREYSHKPCEGRLVATDKVLDCHCRKWFDLKVFPLQGITEFSAKLVFSCTPTHNNTLPESYFKDIDFSVCGPYLRILYGFSTKIDTVNCL